MRYAGSGAENGFSYKAARKLLDFPEALERDNYIQAVSREFFINYENLKTLVNQLENRLGMGPEEPGSQGKRAPKLRGAPAKKKEKEEEASGSRSVFCSQVAD